MANNSDRKTYQLILSEFFYHTEQSHPLSYDAEVPEQNKITLMQSIDLLIIKMAKIS